MNNRPEYFPDWMGEIPRASAPWSLLEEQELLKGYNNGLSIADLENKHGRGYGGITSRLVKLVPNFEIIENKKERLRQSKNELEKLKIEIGFIQDELLGRLADLNTRVKVICNQLDLN